MTIPANQRPKGRTVVLVAFDDAELLDVTGPADVFAAASARVAPAPGYRLRLVAPGDRIRSSAGLVLECDPLAAYRGPVDTLLVAGGWGVEAFVADGDAMRHVSRLAQRARRVTSVCTGAFALAAIGQLDGRRATTHWVAGERLRAFRPQVEVEPDRIYVRDGHVWTSAGVTAGMDLALALVADDHGHELARDVARWLVLPVRRAGGQSQYSPQLAAAVPDDRPIAELLAWMDDHLDADLSVAALARRAHLSERHLARRFRDETGTTPGEHVEALRIDAARRLLETTTLDVDTIARRCGLGTRETLHRTFRRRLDTTPAAYRRSFGA